MKMDKKTKAKMLGDMAKKMPAEQPKMMRAGYVGTMPQEADKGKSMPTAKEKMADKKLKSKMKKC